jgi:hypothetical protein
MTPKRKAALEWIKAGHRDGDGAPSAQMLDRLLRDDLIEDRPGMTDYNVDPEGIHYPAGFYLTEKGEEALRQAQPAMSFQEAITADSIFRGYDLPKSSNHDKPERRVASLIAKGWLVEDGKSLTKDGALAVAAFGEREGWHPDRIEELQRLAANIEAIQEGMKD